MDNPPSVGRPTEFLGLNVTYASTLGGCGPYDSALIPSGDATAYITGALLDLGASAEACLWFLK